MTHYDTLRVLPSAEDPVIRAAYRSLMRLYHPDMNHGPEAQLRVREITAAFAVLGDPHKRAAYDSQRMLHNDTDVRQRFRSDQNTRPPMRNLGIASITLALVISLATPLWLKASQPARREAGSSVSAGMTQTTSASHFLAPGRETDLPRLTQASRSPVGTVTAPVRPPEKIDRTSSVQPDGRSFIASRDVAEAVVVNERRSTARPSPVLPVAMRKTAPPIQSAVQRAPVADKELSPRVTCRGSSSSTGNGACTEDRRVQIERLASGFLNQSIGNADWHKQELLLSARNRAAFSRAMCHSDECAIATYMRQMRETTEIMRGRVPTP